MPIVPILVYGGLSALVGGTAFGAYKGASESVKTVMIFGGLAGLGYVLYRGRK